MPRDAVSAGSYNASYNASYNGALGGAPAGGYADTHGLAGGGMQGGGVGNGVRPTLGEERHRQAPGAMGQPRDHLVTTRTAGGAGQYTTAGRGGAGGEGGMVGMRAAYSNRGGSVTPGAGHSGAMTPGVRRSSSLLSLQVPEGPCTLS